MTQQLDLADPSNKVARVATPVLRTRAYRFTSSDGKPIVIAWWDTFFAAGYEPRDRVSLTLPWTAATAVARPAVPPLDRGADVNEDDPASAFQASRLTPKGGKIQLSLGANPVWISTE
ncbi:MAG: hypothetical protein HYX75_22505 [Acidobacteria bacterium]|nr:hypothetical protein [Acidobacteriota bacterium]